ncbi:MAG TPA: ABC-F type ribosomal protection protein [Haloplasmataceae bacterium]
MLLEMHDIKKYYGDQLILSIDHLKIYSGERIGIVGNNGVGKTTLLHLLSGTIEPDQGIIKRYGSIGYVTQHHHPIKTTISGYWASRFQINTTYHHHFSGGELTRFKIAQVLETQPELLLLDEPTSHLDLDGIRLLEEILKNYFGAIVVVSHDRELLDHICTDIIEIDQAALHRYKGNYSNYQQQKQRLLRQQYREYESYVREKRRLQQIIQRTKEHKQGIRNTPKRMGNSEARRLKTSSQKATGQLERFIKSVEKRLERLEVKEKPFEHKPIQFDIQYTRPSYSQVMIEGKRINHSFGHKVLFQNASFTLENGKKVALIGPNGSGKSTLIKMIVNGHPSIKISPSVNIGYFSQTFDQLDNQRTVLENVMESSAYPEPFVRILLARLLFRGDSIYKPIDVLSGGERVKVAFAKLLVQNYNCLILDEPTNSLDIESIEALEDALIAYPHTLLVATHDRHFINSFANELWIIKDRQIHTFSGHYNDYIHNQIEKDLPNKRDLQLEKLLLETKLSEIVGKLSLEINEVEKHELNEQYEETLKQLKRLTSNI